MEKIKRVKRVPHLYERQYQTEAGERRVKFYAKFTCALKHKPRTMALGSDIQAAKEALALVLADNVKGRDFDAGAGSDGITFSEWCKDYFDKRMDPERRAGGIDRDKRSFKKLEPFFGGMRLSDIKRTTIMEYQAKRLKETWHGRAITFRTVNRELTFLKTMLRLAEDDGIVEQAPRIKLKSEKEFKRERTASTEEYSALLAGMNRPVQRVLIALHETAMRINEVLRLKWPHIDEKAGFHSFTGILREGKEEKDRSDTPSAESGSR